MTPCADEKYVQKSDFAARYQHWLLGLLVLAALLVRLPNLHEPPFFRSTRPYIGLMQARHIYFQLDPPAEAWRAGVAADFFGEGSMLELPVQSSAAAVIYMALGHESIWVAQFLPVLAWLLGVVFLFRLGRNWLSPAAALAATAFYLFAPFGIGLSRLPQPDALMTALLLGTWWLLARWQQQPDTGRIRVLAAFCFAAILVKPTCGPLIVVPAGLVLWRVHCSWRSLLQSRVVWMGLILPMVLASGYYVYRALYFPSMGKQAEMSFVPQLYLSLDYLSGWWRKLGECAGQIPLLLGLTGWLRMEDRNGKWFLGSLWAGYLAYGLVFNYHISTHDYYSLPLLPIIGLSLGAGLEQLAALRPQREKVVWTAAAALLLLLVWSMQVCWQTLRAPTETGKARSRLVGRWWGVNEAFLEAIHPAPDRARKHFQALREIGQLVGHSRHCIFLTRDYANALNYHGEVAGRSWPMTSDLEGQRLRGQLALSGEELLAQYRQEIQAEYFIITNLWELLQQKDLMLHLSTRHELLATNEHYRIYRLK